MQKLALVLAQGLLLAVTGPGAATAGPVGAPPDWSSRAAFELAPEELQAAAAVLPEDKRSEVAILWSNVAYTIDDRGCATVRRTMVYRLPRAAEDSFEAWDVVAASWAPWHQDRPVVRARVVSPAGEVRELDPASLSDRPAARWSDDVFSDARVLEAPLPGLVDGVLVETLTESVDREPLFTAGVAYREKLLAAPYTHAGRISIAVPTGLPLHWKVTGNGEVVVTDSTAAGVRSLVFEYAAISRPEKYQWAAPAELLPDPEVTFSTARDWPAVAAAYARIVDDKIRASGIARWLGGPAPKGGREATIDHVLRRLYRDVRYTGLEFGAQSIVPFGPDETLRRGFGDCKDQASLVVAALRHLGVPAHVALLRTGRDRDNLPEVPGLGLFDHAIAFVPGEPEYWIDPTFRFSRAGELPFGDEGRLALVADPATRGLVPVASAPDARRRIQETREIWLAPIGRSRVRETTEYFGAEEAEARARHEASSSKELREGFEEYVKTSYLNAKLDRYELPPADDFSQPYRLVLEISESGRAQADANEAAFALTPAELLQHVPWALQGGWDDDDASGDLEADDEARTLPYLLDPPRVAVTRYLVHLPAGLAPRETSSQVDGGSGPVRLSTWMKVVAPDRVEAEARLEIDRATLDPTQYEATRKAIAEWQEAPPQLVLFDQAVTKAVMAGEIRAALELSRELVASEPKSWFRRHQLAQALLAAGLGRVACLEAERGTELEPKSAPALGALAWCLQHDEIGRHFGPGFRRADAIAAYRRALALDPDDANAAINLAILLEHDERGRRQNTGAALEEPLAIYRRLVKKQPAVRISLIVTLLRAGRAEEALQHLSRQDPEPVSRQLRIAALALAQGGPAAVSEARRWLTDTAQRSAVLRGATMDLMSLRAYDAASTIARAAAAAAPNAAELLRMADALATAAAAKFPEDSPEASTTRLAIAAKSMAPAESLRPMLAGEVVAVLGDRSAELAEGGATVRQLLANQAAASSLDLDALLEFGVRSAEQTKEGSDDFGYRVTMTAAAFGGTERYFMVPSANGWKAAYSRRPTGALGAMALAALEKNDLAGARRWLDWAFDEDQGEIVANVVQRLWSKGREAGSDEIRRTALALVVEAGADAKQEAALRVLSDGDQVDDPTRFAVDLALARGALQRLDGAALLAAAEALLQRGGASPEILSFKIGALERLGRWEELRQLAKQEHPLKPVAALARRAEAIAEFGSGRIPEGIAIVEKLDAEGLATALELNSAAWGSLFLADVDPRALRWAQRAAEMTGFASPAVLHTLAAVHAWTGGSSEGHRILMQSLATDGQPPPEASTWLVMARLSESYGLPEVAAELYRRAAADSDERRQATSVATLARLQLGKLGSTPRAR